MKFLRLVFFFCLLMNSYSSLAQEGTFVINGTINSQLPITEIYFAQGSFINNAIPKAKKVVVQNGKFTISGSIAEPGPAFLSIAEDLKPKDPADFKQFVLDKGTILIIVPEKLARASITGSKANDEVVNYTAGQSPYMAKLGALNEAAERQSQLGVPVDSIIKMYYPSLKSAGRDLVAYQKNYISKNPSAVISVLLLPEIARGSFNFFEADSSFQKLDISVRSSPTGKAIGDYITREKRTSIGAFAPDFSSSDTSGQKFSLSSLKGKYVLIDFWAAWCGPCRQENPNVVRAFNKFKDKGFTILGVSLDRDRKDWLKGVRDDKLTWTQVSDLKHFESPTAVLYGINSIPRNFLIDPTGKIIARDLRGPDLDERLEEILK